MFYITISNGLLKDEHRTRIGTAVWEFMWLIDKVTRIDEDGVGWVLGGKPIKLREMAKDMGVTEDTISVNLIKLEKEGYIKKLRTPYGIGIKVNKAKKGFGRESGKTPNLLDSGKTSNLTEETSNLIKTVSVDNNRIDIAAKTPQAGFSLKEYLKKMEDDPRRPINVIGHYFEEKGLKFDTIEEARSAVKRHLRPAKEVANFSDDKIVKATDQAKREYGDKFTVETILKCLTR